MPMCGRRGCLATVSGQYLTSEFGPQENLGIFLLKHQLQLSAIVTAWACQRWYGCYSLQLGRRVPYYGNPRPSQLTPWA